jgi:hypothetical protein
MSPSSYCLKPNSDSEEDEDQQQQQQQQQNIVVYNYKKYEPTSTVTFLHDHLPSFSTSTLTTTSNSGLVYNWIQDNDPTSYALGVVTSWTIVSSVLFVWLLLLGILPLLCKRRRGRCCHGRRKAGTEDDDDHYDIEQEVEYDEEEEEEEEYHSAREHQSDKDAKEEEGFVDFVEQRQVESQQLVQLQIQPHPSLSSISLLSMSQQYLSYCVQSNTRKERTSTRNHDNNNSSVSDEWSSNLNDESSSIDLLTVNDEKSEASPDEEPVNEQRENTNKLGYLQSQVPTMDAATLSSDDESSNDGDDDDDDADKCYNLSMFATPDSKLQNASIAIFEDEQEQEHLPKELEQTKPAKTTTTNTTTTNISSISTIMMETSFPSHFVEEGFLFVDEDDASNEDNDENDYQKANYVNHQIVDCDCPKNQSPDSNTPLPLTSMINKATNTSTYSLQYSNYASKAASRKRLLENYVQTLKTTQGNPSSSSSSYTPETSPTSTVPPTATQEQEPIRAIHPNVDAIDHDNVVPVVSSSSCLPSTPRRNKQRQQPEQQHHVKFDESTTIRDQTKYQPRRNGNNNNTTKNNNCCHLFQRIIVLIASTFLIVSTILLIINGIWAVRSQSTKATSQWYELKQQLTDVPTQIVEDIQYEKSNNIIPALYKQWYTLDRSCPKIQPSICAIDDENRNESMSSSSSSPPPSKIFYENHTNTTIRCQLQDMPLRDIWYEYSSAVQPQRIEKLWNEYYHPLVEAQYTANSVIEEYDLMVENPIWDIAFYVMLYVTLGASVLLSLMVFGIVWIVSSPTTATPTITQTRRRLDVPFCCFSPNGVTILFWTLVLVVWICGGWFSVGTVLTADTCYTPGNEVPLALLQRSLNNDDDGASLIVDYWYDSLSQKQEDATCFGNSNNDGVAPAVVNEMLSEWDRIIEVSNKLTLALDGLPTNIYYDLCGVSMWSIQSTTSDLNDRLCGITRLLNDYQQQLTATKCQSPSKASWMSTYTDLLYQSICTDGSTSLVWITSTLLVILFSAFVIWTFQSTFLPQYTVDDETPAMQAIGTMADDVENERSSRNLSKGPWYLNNRQQATLDKQ